ncbi:MAG TPA: hypothetical protein VFV35_03535 [Acidimicrobiales bacterium]|nr:hypothetical protein [Acidimicrobiales bacterium]
MNRLPDLPGVLSTEQVQATADSIAAVQQPGGKIPWFPGGHADPWNHVECAMALVTAGRRAEACRAFDWLAATQLEDGSWFTYYLDDGIEDERRDTNVSTYVAVGAWHHWRVTGDLGFLEEVFPMVDRAIAFALRLQQPGGEVLWSLEPGDLRPADYALLTGSSSVLLSLRCAVAIAEVLGIERSEWYVAAVRLAEAVGWRDGTAFADKHRWAMDWYYPVLGGALVGERAAARIEERWERFVLPGFGVRCVSSHEWVTAAETAECVMALDAVGRRDEARRLLTWVQYLREPDGSYWTGCVHPDESHFPVDERSTYTAGAMILAWDALSGATPASGLFRGEGLPAVVVDEPTFDFDPD